MTPIAALGEIDLWVLECVERVANSIQRTFGITSVHLERTFLIVAAAWVTDTDLFRAHGYRLALDYIVLFGLLIRLIFAEVRRGWSASPTMNITKLDPLRKYILVMVAICIYDDVRDLQLWFEFSAIAYYLSACDDLPPGLSRVRKFVDSFRLSPKMQEVNS